MTRPQLTPTILIGGSIAGVLDGLDAVIFYGLAFGATPTRIFQNIASALLGRRSFQEGFPTVILGVMLHFAVALGAAAIYFALSRFIPLLYTRPWVSGPIFGLGLYCFMHYIVVPLSRVAPRAHAPGAVETLDQLLSHAFCVGLPIALMARRSARAS